MDDQVSQALSAKRATWLSLAVNDRRGGRRRTKANLMDVRGRPQTVLKTAGLRYTDV
jgi:hypothetical protein